VEAQKSQGDDGSVAGRGYHITGNTSPVYGRHRRWKAHAFDVNAAEGVAGVWDACVVVLTTKRRGGRDDNNDKYTNNLSNEYVAMMVLLCCGQLKLTILFMPTHLGLITFGRPRIRAGQLRHITKL